MIPAVVAVVGLVLGAAAGVALLVRRGRSHGRHAAELADAVRTTDDALVCRLEELLGLPPTGPAEDLSTPEAVEPLRAAAAALVDACAAIPDAQPPCTVPDCPTCASWAAAAVQAYEQRIQERALRDPAPFWFPRRQP